MPQNSELPAMKQWRRYGNMIIKHNVNVFLIMFIYFKCSTNPYIGFSRLDLESAVSKTQVNNASSVFLNMFSQNVNTLEMDRDDSRDCELATVAGTCWDSLP